MPATQPAETQRAALAKRPQAAAQQAGPSLRNQSPKPRVRDLGFYDERIRKRNEEQAALDAAQTRAKESSRWKPK